MRPGRKVKDFPAPPVHPEFVKMAILNIGRARVCRLLDIHRSTLTRWMTGAATIPHAAWLVLKMMDDGLLPGMSEAWAGVRVVDDRLVISGRAYTAGEIGGLPLLHQALESCQRKLAETEKMLADALRRVNWGSANDPYQNPQDVRAKAFAATP